MKKILMAAAIYLMAVSCGTAPQNPEQNVANDKNEVIETILTRRSIRAYKDQAVPKELLDQVLECGVWAPNAINAQQWEVRVVMSEEWINSATAAAKEAAKGTPAEAQFNDPSFKNLFRNAPAVIFIGHKPGAYTPVDCGLMAGNIMLAAKSLGLGTVCMASPVRTFLLTEAGASHLTSLGFSEGYEPLICIGIGYPDEEPAAKPRNMEVIKYVE
ncbi:MAG: nitroreductase family protein [Alistipes sp.]|nr:nitroreductase family protein [Alistipes sp.]MBQ6581591.1 nitroreductase family protein [Alistipes sp.]